MTLVWMVLCLAAAVIVLLFLAVHFYFKPWAARLAQREHDLFKRRELMDKAYRARMNAIKDRS